MTRIWLARAFCVMAGLAWLAFSNSCTDRWAPSLNTDVYLVPIGELRIMSLKQLAEYYESTLGLKMSIGPRLSPSSQLYNPDRQQFVAQRLIGALESQSRKLPSHDKTIFVGVSERPMYIEGKNWRFAYAFRSGRHRAVVSTTYMDPRNWGEKSSDEQVRRRARKMVTKCIAVLYYRLPQNDKPRSVLYNRVLGLEDLDGIDEATVESDVVEAAQTSRARDATNP